MTGNEITGIWHDEAERLYAELKGRGYSASGAYEFELMKVEAERQAKTPRKRLPFKPLDKAKRRAKNKLQRKARKGNRK